MKKLLIIRHAKSSWDHDVNDIDRSLSERGVKDAYRTSNYISGKVTPDVVFCSPANRALHTCSIFLRTLGISFEKLRIVEDMYDFGGEKVVALLRSLDERYNDVMIFGHNYALTSLCNIFGDVSIDNLPTAGVVVIQFHVQHWDKIERGHTEFTIFPKQLR